MKKEEKAKWTKEYKNLTKSAETNPDDDISDDEVSKRSDSSVHSRCEPDNYQSDSSSSSSSGSSASDTDSK